MEEQLDELLPPTHRASKALLKSNVDQVCYLCISLTGKSQYVLEN